MASKKKQVRAVVRRFARMVIEQHYRSTNVSRPKSVINKMVKEVEHKVVPTFMKAVKGEVAEADISSHMADIKSTVHENG